MPTKSELIEQSDLAFDFIQKLYLETSYLIKEVEGILHDEEERFVIGRPAGYGITSARSTGLESNSVMQWLMRKLIVFFVPEDKTKVERGQTITMIDNNLRVIILRIVFNDKNINEPVIYPGVLYKIEKKQQTKWTKFEHAMGHIEYNGDKIFKDISEIKFEDAYMKLQGKLKKERLFDIKDSDSIVDIIIKPTLALYRK
ncbi:hypothetical protein ACFL0Q_07885 [Thermodesulfobacteriota bacterium]